MWLLRDEPTEARQEATGAVRGWSAEGYHIQHWYGLIAETHIDLYEGDGPAAHARVTAGWPALRKSNLLRMQHTRVVATHLRARAALAAAAATEGSGRAPLLALARRSAARLERERTGWASAFAGLLHAGVDRLEGRPERSAEWLRRAMSDCATEGLRLFQAAAEIAAAPGGGGERWMLDAGVRSPAAVARMLAPALLA